MQTHEIISRFTDHFVNAGHTRVPSASLILDDPTLLFVNAGMVQFKPYFLGDAPPPYPRATSIQKCVRTGDIEEVGKTTRHNTFFQMAGNFSFGDYFKEGAIDLAWSLVTDAYGIDPDRLWATVYRDDDEAFALWRRLLPEERIQRRGGKDNYWDMGVPGPGGPCSEIYFDRGPEHGRDGGPVADEDRYLEIWNLVFMQDVRGDRSPKDDFPPIGSLPKKNIDTGMGVERVATLLQDVENVYETDLVRPVIARAEEFSGRRYGASVERRRALPGDRRPRPLRCHDHRRRRDAVQRGPRLRAAPPAAPDRALGAAARRPRAGAARVRRGRARRDGPVVPGARHRLRADLRGRPHRGGGVPADPHHRLEDLRTAVATTRQAGSTQLPGDQAFKLHDTYGFPIDLTLEMAAEAGLTVDEQGFRDADGRAAQPGQGRRRRAQGTATPTARPTAPCSTRRAAPRSSATPTWWPSRGSSGWSSTASGCPRPAPGTAVEVILDRTPFYAEGGGQQADTGWIRGDGCTSSTSPTCSRRWPGSSCTGAPCARARSRWARARRPRSTRAAAARSPGRTRPPTSSTRACARRSGTPRPRRGRSTRRGGCASTSPRPRGRCPPPCWRTSRTRSTTSC